MSKRILIVDDDPLLCDTLEEALTEAGYECYSVLSGREALRYLESELPDLILLDINMPDVSGFEIARHVRADPRTGQLPIIMLTIRLDAASRKRGMEAGADDYLTKPITTSELIERIRAVLSKGSPG